MLFVYVALLFWRSGKSSSCFTAWAYPFFGKISDPERVLWLISKCVFCITWFFILGLWKFNLSIYLFLIIFVSRYRGQNLISIFFPVQKISVPPIEMVCYRTMLAIWENDERSASWALPMEYGYHWCTRGYGMWKVLNLLVELYLI